MPHSNSARKRVRQNQRRADANRSQRTALRTAVRRTEDRIQAGDAAGARAALPEAYQRLDKAAKRRVVHPKQAANQKSRLARAVARLAQGA
jgi:small subunit ribosomal protein S20